MSLPKGKKSDTDVWLESTEDFGQKVDLSVRIREILRNYPEGLSILKELIQNADDANGERYNRYGFFFHHETILQEQIN